MSRRAPREVHKLVDDDTVLSAHEHGQKAYVTRCSGRRVVVRFKDVRRVLDLVGARA